MSDEIDYENQPAIAMSQWREGRTLSAADVVMIAALLKELDDEMNQGVDAFSSGREQALRELGGQELVDMVERGDVAAGKLAYKRACISVGEKEAALAKLNQ